MHVRIYHHSLCLPKPGAEYDVCSLARYSRERKQLMHLFRNITAEFSNDLSRGSDYRLRLVAKKSRGLNVRLQLLRLEFCELLHGRISLEQLWSDHVHAHVRGLGGENRSDQQFPRALVGQGASYIGVELIKAPQNISDSFWRCQIGPFACPRKCVSSRGTRRGLLCGFRPVDR